MAKPSAGKSVYLTQEEITIINAICESIIQNQLGNGGSLESKIFDRVTKHTVAQLQKKL
jgi:hypothetical protein